MTSLELTAMQLEDLAGSSSALFTIKNTKDFDSAHYAQMKAEAQRVSKMLDVLETFNGQTFLNFPSIGGVSLGNGQPVSAAAACNDEQWSGWRLAA
jgi:hypothetical protein